MKKIHKSIKVLGLVGALGAALALAACSKQETGNTAAISTDLQKKLQEQQAALVLVQKEVVQQLHQVQVQEQPHQV